MTSLLCWTGKDQRANSSLYLASDSRITNQGVGWDAGRKLFASSLFPDVLGYCGEAFFPTTVLSQIVDSIDLGILFKLDDSITYKVDRIIEVLINSLRSYFHENINFDIVYGSRTGFGTECTFHVTAISCREKHVHAEFLPIPQKSGSVVVLGSGADSVNRSIREWSRSDAAGTSRMFFSAFWESVESGADPKTAGPVQLVGIYRKGPAKTFGIISKGERFINGQLLGDEIHTETVPWHNELFEVCDGKSKGRRTTAQPQPRPLNVK